MSTLIVKQASISNHLDRWLRRHLSSSFHRSTDLSHSAVGPWRKAFYHPKWTAEKDQITSGPTPAAHKEVLRWTMELPRAPPLSPSWAGRPEPHQSLGSEQPHGWTKCSHHNLIVIVLPSNVKAISFQDCEGMGVGKDRSEARVRDFKLISCSLVWY